MTEKFFTALTARPRLVLLTALLLLVPCVFGYLHTGISYDLFSYLPADLESVRGERQMNDSFGDTSSLFLAVEGKTALETAALEKKIEATTGVKTAVWVDDIFDVTVPAEVLPSFVKDVFYSDDGKCTLMLVMLDGEDAGGTRNAVGSIRHMLPEGCYLSGTSAILADTKALADRQVPLYIIAAAVVSFALMLFTTSSWVTPFLLLITLGLGVVYNMGTNVAFGEISYITQSIAVVLQLAVTMDYSIFLVDRYAEEKRRVGDSRTAVVKAACATISSVSGSMLTTVAGFAALCFMRLTLGRDIGLVMIKGTLLGALTVIVVLPSLLLLADTQMEKLRHRSILPDFSRPVRFVLRHRTVFAALLFTLLIPGALLQNKAEKYYNLIATLPEDMASVAALDKVKNEFDMVTTHFVIVDDSLSAAGYSALINEIEATDNVTNVIAYNKYVGPAVPESLVPDQIRDLCKKNGQQVMLINSSLTAGTNDMSRQLEQLRGILDKYDKGALITGEGALYEDLIRVADSDFTMTGLLSVALVFMIIAAQFSSLLAPVVLVAAIELSIFLNESVPYLMGTTVSFISPTVVGCVQLGATVDYAILLLSRAREERRGGAKVKKSVRLAATSSAKSITGSALVFFGTTFAVYLISDIEIIKSICAMLARGALLSAAVIILLLTPLLAMSGRLLGKGTEKT